MKRFACLAAACLAATLGVGVSSARAQPPVSDPDSRVYADLNFGPTLGHKSDAFIGVEAGYRLTDSLDVIIDAGHMGNVATSHLDAVVAPFANFVGATASTAIKVNYFTAGVRYSFDLSPMKVRPYILGAIGAARVNPQVTFAINGTVVDPASVGVQLGSDTSGSLTKTMIVIGFGVHYPFASRFFGDLGYRYGSILAKTDVVDTDQAIPTQRIILGAGIRF